MSLRRTLATSRRILLQLRHDPRTLALLLLVPSLLETILKYVFNSDTAVFSSLAPLLVGIFPFIVMFLVTSITTLRERTTGTLERLMTLPITKLELILGYTLAFALLALLQALITGGLTISLLGVSVAGGTPRLLLVAVLAGVLGETLGLFVSAFATSEFQVVQFMPAVIFPQLLTCGLFVPRDHMAGVLRWFADVMPLTYLADAMKHVNSDTGWSHDLVRDLLLLVGYIVAAVIVSSLTLRRQA
jgi:ABC-2 type transport system permease protein